MCPPLLCQVENEEGEGAVEAKSLAGTPGIKFCMLKRGTKGRLEAREVRGALCFHAGQARGLKAHVSLSIYGLCASVYLCLESDVCVYVLQLVVPAYTSLAAQIRSHRDAEREEAHVLKQRVLQVSPTHSPTQSPTTSQPLNHYSSPLRILPTLAVSSPLALSASQLTFSPLPSFSPCANVLVRDGALGQGRVGRRGRGPAAVTPQDLQRTANGRGPGALHALLRAGQGQGRVRAFL
jgi:hypothetical protein